MTHFLYALQAVIPVFLLILTGYVLKRSGRINQNFIHTGSRLVFQFALPALLVLRISSMDRGLFMSLRETVLVLAVPLGITLISWIAAAFRLPPEDRGVFVQGAFRSNMAIIGLALVQGVYGEPGVEKAALMIALLIPLFNFLATLAITVPLARAEERGRPIPSLLGNTLIKLIKNPLMIAIALGFLLFLLSWELPVVVEKPLSYLSPMALPLGLICIGGGIDFSTFRDNLKRTVLASVFKILLMPLSAAILGLLWRMEPLDMGVLVLLMGSPTAVSSFPMAQALGGNGKLAANIVALSTLLSIFSLGLALTILGAAGYLQG